MQTRIPNVNGKQVFFLYIRQVVAKAGGVRSWLAFAKQSIGFSDTTPRANRIDFVPYSPNTRSKIASTCFR